MCCSRRICTSFYDLVESNDSHKTVVSQRDHIGAYWVQKSNKVAQVTRHCRTRIGDCDYTISRGGSSTNLGHIVQIKFNVHGQICCGKVRVRIVIVAPRYEHALYRGAKVSCKRFSL